MVSCMYTIKMKLKNSVAQIENYQASLSKRMNIEKRDYQNLMWSKGSWSKKQIRGNFLKVN